ncbi:MAG: hypothetical protein PHT26_15995 [Lentimicrobiaceae bacterium]|nr:hypothetical protein [Lentimicrobiaceae bacterium]
MVLYSSNARVGLSMVRLVRLVRQELTNQLTNQLTNRLSHRLARTFF